MPEYHPLDVATARIHPTFELKALRMYILADLHK